ncbi:hypothetical protein KAU33_07860 [Candidatus Dependentiae bacterium]|nr:hypothetical protein [Candidatus Dependentiae bacterium]
MKKFSLSKLRLVFLCFLIIFTTLGCSKMSDEERISSYKNKTYKFLDEHQDYFDNPETRKEAEALINKYKLTDEECLEIQSQILSKIDIEKFTVNFKIEDYRNKNDFILDFIILVHLIDKWEATLSKEDIIMKKFIPILKGSDIKLKMHWISHLEFALLSIHNEKLPFKEENRYMVMDFLIEIISNKSYPEFYRYSCAEAWEEGEKREEVIYEVFNVLLQDEEVFEKIGQIIIRLTWKAPQLYDMMFSVLEDRENYSDKITLGTLEFFFRDSFNFRNDTQGKRRIRLKKVLNNIVKKERAQVLIDKSELILSNIKYYEKEGRYK